MDHLVVLCSLAGSELDDRERVEVDCAVVTVLLHVVEELEGLHRRGRTNHKAIVEATVAVV